MVARVVHIPRVVCVVRVAQVAQVARVVEVGHVALAVAAVPIAGSFRVGGCGLVLSVYHGIGADLCLLFFL